MPDITQKELEAIEQQLKLMTVIIEKYKLFASETRDAQLKSSCEKLIAEHQSHVGSLIKLLEE